MSLQKINEKFSKKKFQNRKGFRNSIMLKKNQIQKHIYYCLFIINNNYY